MLTGDKLETAENIGYSCSLIQSDFEKLYIFETDDLEEKYKEHSQKIKMLKQQNKRVCLLVEGKAISNFQSQSKTFDSTRTKEQTDQRSNDPM